MPTTDIPSDDSGTQHPEGKRLALVVGINNSSTTPPNWLSLEYAEKDAKDMAYLLESEACNFTLLEPALIGKKAAAWRIKNAMTDLVLERGEHDFLLFYFSGHTEPMNNDIYFVTDDFEKVKVKADPTRYISMRWLLNVLYQSTGAGSVLIILDCCYAGNMADFKQDSLQKTLHELMDEWDNPAKNQAQQNHLRLILAASGYNKPAREVGGHGRMTGFIVKTLEGDEKGIADKEGKIDIHSLHRHLLKQMPDGHISPLEGKITRECILARHPKLAENYREEAQQAEKNEILALLRSMQGGIVTQPHAQPFDLVVCREASFDDLDQEKVAEFFQRERVQEKVALRSDASDRDKLLRLSLLQELYPTYAALLCFGQNLPQWISGAKTRCIYWSGTNNLFGFRDSQFYEDGLLKQFELSCAFLQKHLQLGRVIDSEGSTERWEIPFVVLREALANALIHREYANRTDFVLVEIFDDRVEISSPGDLPSHISLEALQREHGSHPRNTQIASIFYLYGYVEEAGSGIPRMQHSMKEAELREPKFDLTSDNRFKVTLYRPKHIPEASKPQRQFIWNVPFRHNLFFTGRDEVLQQLHNALRAGKSATLTHPHAISGLGGIGKTQIAIEYAYRYRDDYQAILWVRAYSYETLVSDFVTIAVLLNLPERDDKDQNHIVQAVKRWLQSHTDWLLIFDNADDLIAIGGFIPPGSRGHILLTTRVQATGQIAQHIEINKMQSEEGALFLLRRANIIAPNALLNSASEGDRMTAYEIAEMVDGLPLALDQAAAFIEEAGCSLSTYLELYKRRWAELLKVQRGGTSDYPESVATVWSHSFEMVEQANPAAAELLRFFAFLHPDAIPDEIITEGSSELGPTLQKFVAHPILFNAALSALRRYSLVSRNPDGKTITLHRLIQAILKDNMDEGEQFQWAERTIRAVNRVFPEVELVTWPRCQRLLPHAQVCAVLIEQWGMESLEAARLLNQAGEYLQARTRYAETEPLYQRALMIREKLLGSEHLDVAQSLNNLARLYDALGQYTQAEPLYQRALAIRERTLGPEHPDVARSLNNLARIYGVLGQYVQAEPLYQRALTIDEQALGPEHPDVAIDLNNLALLYYNQGKYGQAEPLYQRALEIDERILGSDHPNIAIDLNNLGLLYFNQNKYEQAEPLLQRALHICEQVLGPTHPDIINSLNNLALLYYTQRKYIEAEPLLQRALTIGAQYLGAEHPHVAVILMNYAALLRDTGREAVAKTVEERIRNTI